MGSKLPLTKMQPNVNGFAACSDGDRLQETTRQFRIQHKPMQFLAISVWRQRRCIR